VETRGARVGLWVWAIVFVAFLWLPIVIMGLYAFNVSNVQSWPIPGFTTHWFSVAWNDPEVRDALWLSVKAGLTATSIALVLGSLAAFALARARFFGRNSISFVFVLPICPAGDHHRDRAQLVLRVLVDPAVVLDDRRRPRHVLCRHRVQQRRRPAAPELGVLLRGLGRPRCGRLADISLCDVSGRSYGSSGRWTARLRALVRRGGGHVLHRRCAEHIADPYLRLPAPGGSRYRS
jgi:hypothetical protein